MINKDLKAHLKSVGAFACIVALMASSAITPVSVAHANEPDTIIETGEEQKSSEIIDCGEFNGLNWAINTDRLLTITGVYSGEKGSDESFPWYFSSRDVSYVLLDCELNGDVSDLLEGIKFVLYSVEF